MASKRKPKGYYTSSFDAIRKAQQLLDECDVRSVPVNLVSLARHQGIKQIIEMDTRLDGQLLELEDGGYEVILSKNASVARKRFTLAHEIAHTLFAGQDSEGLACGEEVVEELCNAAAAEILIPSRFLQKTFPRGKEVTVESILEVTRLFECSLEAAAWRLLNSGLIEGALLIWRLKTIPGQQPQVLELTSIPQTWGFQMPVSRGMELHPGDPLWQALMSDESRLVELKGFHSGQSYQGECFRLNKIVLVLIRTGARYQDRAVRERTTGQGKLAF